MPSFIVLVVCMWATLENSVAVWLNGCKAAVWCLSSAGCHPRVLRLEMGAGHTRGSGVSLRLRLCLWICLFLCCCTTEPQTSRQNTVEGSSAGSWITVSRSRWVLMLSSFGSAGLVISFLSYFICCLFIRHKQCLKLTVFLPWIISCSPLNPWKSSKITSAFWHELNSR